MIVENFQVFAQQKHLNLIFVPQQTFLQADFVPEYFQKVMHNLLSNALKYTPKGGHIYILYGHGNRSRAVACQADGGDDGRTDYGQKCDR